MERNNIQGLSRREFLRLAATVTGAVAMSSSTLSAFEAGSSKAPSNEAIPRLNPAFRIKEIAADEIELFTHLGDGRILKHQFKGLEADFFRQVNQEQPLQSIVTSLATKYKLSTETCQQQINQSLREFETAKLIYFGDKMLVKIVEVTHDQ